MRAFDTSTAEPSLERPLQPYDRGFYSRPTLAVARSLLGQILVYEDSGGRVAGRIVETEAYIGESDPACHAAGGVSARNSVMYGRPGMAYIYFIYGMYHCLNAVTETEGFPAAVLIRAVEPLAGVELMKERRPGKSQNDLTNGPGKLCMAFNLDLSLNGADLTRPPLMIVPGDPPPQAEVSVSRRIGISRGAEREWRFFIRNNVHVSPSRPCR